ncbi:lipin Ned1 [Entomophthora muscae]|uniref:Lipin Ned1 n=1 Tax=Entomophthora muscae TaxID=34485 RepID=A0ACC2TG04_9FUNG|nr:lipin Ned1 [Entomophthora muscae]
MQYVGNLFSTVTEFYKELNPATLSGAIDVIVVKQQDGSWACSPFHVRFGKLQLLRPHEKVVEVRVNGELIEFRMKLGEAGEAFFVFESENPVPSEFATSPLIIPDGSDSEDIDYFVLNEGEAPEDPEKLKEDEIIASLLNPDDDLKGLATKQKSLHIGKHVSKDEIVSNTMLKDGEQLILDKKGYNVNSNKRSVIGQHHNRSDVGLGDFAKPQTPTLREVKSDAEGGAFSSDEEHDGNSEGNDRHFSDSEFDYKNKPKSSEIRQPAGYRRWTSWFSRSTVTLALSSDDEYGEPSDLPYKEARGRKHRLEKPGSASSTFFEGDSTYLSAPKKRSNYAKTLRLTSEQLKSINLTPGANEVTFSVGKATCGARIFLWSHDDLVVISDIDGTITKSDALGHLFNMVGKDWTHPGVAKLYSDISRNGYKMLYLTSRAIGQADTTREYLRRIDQSQKQLPEGPVIMSPDRLFQSLHREVVLRKPHLFKTACLKDILSLFGGDSPFYAGFGNRITDALSYRSVNVPVSRIFTIDYNGNIQHELIPSYNSSYLKLNDIVDQIFPSTTSKMVEEFNDWNFWKPAIDDIDLPP